MKGLLLHCGAKQINRDELSHALPTRGALGARHNPVPYIEFVENITTQLDRIGFKITKEAFGVTDENARMFGLMELESDYSDYAPVIGVRGSYDQTLPRHLAIGSGVFVCDNLCFSGDIMVKTKQTTNINQRLQTMIADAIAKLPQMVETQHNKFNAYKEREINPRHGDAALVELVRRGGLTPSQIGRAVNEWDKPKHAEHAQYGYSLWRLMNAVTEAIKPTNANTPAVNATMDRSVILTGLLDEIIAA